MSDSRTFTIEVTMSERWVPQFLGMLATMETLGSVGSSRMLGFYAERDNLYDWLENGRIDVYLRRLIRERLAELEDALPSNSALLDYMRPTTKHGGADEALDLLRGHDDT